MRCEVYTMFKCSTHCADLRQSRDRYETRVKQQIFCTYTDHNSSCNFKYGPQIPSFIEFRSGISENKPALG